MGLAISVRHLNDLARHDPEGGESERAAFAVLNQALAGAGVDWSEPDPDPADDLLHASSFPYSWLNHLRRAYVLRLWGETVIPALDVSAEQYTRDDEKIHDEVSMLSSHLLCHADTEGYYIPVDMDDPLFLDEDSGVRGAGMVGSSQRLRAELIELAPGIDIHPDEDGTLSAEELDRLARSSHTDPFEPEKFAWRQLYAACQASIDSGHAIVFH
ncbi:hypothetical protein [Streptomyces sp. ISL-86]|uniref:hypothetical protein n=1 Tax=Streptomyces sp. ISL-86 TaxID=2819187 RepID=UPI001BE6E4B9|nr:hypothetical protein [Streptomyces sp. ISL-86]MBT2456985.1 hypothetical protein [Streptomyces sp. ISL-86]